MFEFALLFAHLYDFLSIYSETDFGTYIHVLETDFGTSYVDFGITLSENQLGYSLSVSETCLSYIHLMSSLQKDRFSYIHVSETDFGTSI